MSVVENRKEFEFEEFGDFTAFYIAITICTVLGGALFILNIVFCCCSKYKDYWQDSNTGNRWLVTIWTKTPHNQTALDYTELEKGIVPVPRTFPTRPAEPRRYIELQKRESEI